MCYSKKHVFALAIANAFLFTTHNYVAAAAAQETPDAPSIQHESFANPAQEHKQADTGNVNQKLREAILAGDANTVRTMLQQNADPNYTPQPHLPNRMQQWAQKYWYIKEDSEPVALGTAACLVGALNAVGFCIDRQSPYFAPAHYTLMTCIALAYARMAHSGMTRNTSRTPQNNHASTPPIVLAAQLRAPAQTQTSIVQMLLDAKADINDTDAQGGTALHHCEQGYNSDLKRLLIMAGADAQKQNNRGVKALKYVPHYRADEQQVAQRLDRIITHIRSLDTTQNKEAALTTIDFALTERYATYLPTLRLEYEPHQNHKETYPLTSSDELENWALAYRLNAHKQQMLDASPTPLCNATKSRLIIHLDNPTQPNMR